MVRHAVDQMHSCILPRGSGPVFIHLAKTTTGGP